MLIQYASDLHLEFPENKRYIQNNPIVPNGDILVLAGDIIPFALIDKHGDFLDYVADHFEHTYWIPGNHEYYHFDAATKCGTFCEKIRSNVSLVNNWALKTKEAHLIFSTMWSKISDYNHWDIERSMNDFRVIKYKGQRFSYKEYNEFHREGLAFIEGELATAEPTLKKVVVTHHVPTYLNYPKHYRFSLLNEAFAVELFDLLTNTQPDFWIYGHSHTNTPDFNIDKSSILTNQLGYVIHNEHHWYGTKTILL